MRFKRIHFVSVINKYGSSHPILMMLISLLVLSGCVLSEINEQAITVENTGIIKNKSNQDGPIIVERFLINGGIYISEDKKQASAKGKYKFYVEPGRYYIAAFIDANNDGLPQASESFNQYGKPTEIVVK